MALEDWQTQRASARSVHRSPNRLVCRIEKEEKEETELKVKSAVYG